MDVETEAHAGRMDFERGTPIMLGPWMLGLGEPSPETVGYWEGVAAGQLRIKRCAGCDKPHHPRRMFCDRCRGDDLPWVDATGQGTVYTYSVVHRAPTPELQAETPYAIGLVELDEGVHLFTRFYAAEGLSAVAVGAPVVVAFETIGDHGTLPVFRVVESA